MEHYWALFHHLPATGLAGAVASAVQFATKKLAALQLAHKKRYLRGEIVALNAFIANLNEAHEERGSHVSLEDAVTERGQLLNQLAALSLRESKRFGKLPRGGAQWLFLLYAPSRRIGWALRWAFFTLLIATITAAARGLLHVNYLPLPLLIAFLIATFVLAVLVRVAAFYLERVKPSHDSPATGAP